MRFVLYNIRYATGTGAAFHLPVPGAGYLRSNPRVLDGITQFIKSQDPDIVGLIEVDTGSIRTGLVNQARADRRIARPLLHLPVQVRHELDQPRSMPIVRKQGNAFLAAPRVEGERFHYFDTGIKRLIIELELDEVCVFLVHLSLKFRHRHYQLRHLHELVKQVDQAGDRRRRLQHLLGRARDLPVHGGRRPAQRQSSPACRPIPARSPRIELDFVLYSQRHRDHSVRGARRALLGSSAADLRLPGRRRANAPPPERQDSAVDERPALVARDAMPTASPG